MDLGPAVVEPPEGLHVSLVDIAGRLWVTGDLRWARDMVGSVPSDNCVCAGEKTLSVAPDGCERDVFGCLRSRSSVVALVTKEIDTISNSSDAFCSVKRSVCSSLL